LGRHVPSEGGFPSLLWGLGRGARPAKWKELEGEGVHQRQPPPRDEATYKTRGEGPAQKGGRGSATRAGSGACARPSLYRLAGSWGLCLLSPWPCWCVSSRPPQLVDSRFAPAQCVEDNPFHCFLRRWVLLSARTPRPPQEVQPQAQSQAESQPGSDFSQRQSQRHSQSHNHSHNHSHS